MHVISFDSFRSILFGCSSYDQVKVVRDLDGLMANSLGSISLIDLKREDLDLNSYWSPIFVLLKSQIDLINLRNINV